MNYDIFTYIYFSAVLLDPRTTLLTPEIENLCQKSNIELITIDLNYYLVYILTPIFSLFTKQCAEINRLDKMFLKSASDFKRIIYTIWYSLRTLKQNEQICRYFRQTLLWRNDDELYLQSLRSSTSSLLLLSSKKKKKKTLVKTGMNKMIHRKIFKNISLLFLLNDEFVAILLYDSCLNHNSESILFCSCTTA